MHHSSLSTLFFVLLILSVSASQTKGSVKESTNVIITETCKKTQYPTHCVNHFAELDVKDPFELVHVSVKMTLSRVSSAFFSISTISNTVMDTRVRSAYDSCIELIDDSLDQLSKALVTVGGGGGGSGRDDVMTWLSSALTNHDTCTDGFEGVQGFVKDHVGGQLSELSELVSNCLAIFAVTGNDKDFAGVPIQNRRRKLLGQSSTVRKQRQFPKWVGSRTRRLLDAPVSTIKPDFIVSKDGNGTFKTIGEAIHAAPEASDRRIIIYVKAGRYEEPILKIGRKKTNLMFIGDGKGFTIITGGKSIYDNLTTFHTASFAAQGAGFIARDITFENWAGPAKHQAVALRIGADHAVVYRCNVIGYQDTLYVHSNRQFFRECDIYGTVDFIFGNAAVVFQNCSIYARKPMFNQKNTITAQNRKDVNQNSGISIHQCRILPAQDLVPVKGSVDTYLGRPWKLYARAVVMQSFISDHVRPRGWLEWNATFALDTLYYGEYLNYGPGSAVVQRVNWPGYRVINSTDEASKFTVSQFILGSEWLPSTGVTYLAGLQI